MPMNHSDAQYIEISNEHSTITLCTLCTLSVYVCIYHDRDGSLQTVTMQEVDRSFCLIQIG